MPGQKPGRGIGYRGHRGVLIPGFYTMEFSVYCLILSRTIYPEEASLLVGPLILIQKKVHRLTRTGQSWGVFSKLKFCLLKRL